MSQLYQASAVAIGGKALLIEGPPGSGKSSLALALIDRGATLIGDDGVMLERGARQLIASPPPNIAGLLEVRNVGLIRTSFLQAAPVALVLRLTADAPRFVDAADSITLLDVAVPLIRLWPDSPVLALRAEAALAQWGLPTD